MKRLFVRLAQALVEGNCKVDYINYRAIEFVLHYIKGSQTPMTLRDDEIAATKRQILRTLKSESYDFGEASITLDDDMFDDKKTIMECFLTGKTTGLVGGFDYTVDENMVAHCIDTWDFNTNNCFCLILYIPKSLIKAVKLMTNKLGLPEELVTIWREDTAKPYLTVNEANLAVLNATHEFKTRWTVDFSGESCPIDFYEYKI